MYFIADVGVKAACFIYHETVAVFMEDNVERHIQTKPLTFGHNLFKHENSKYANDLSRCLNQQQFAFYTTYSFQKNATKASSVLANKIANQNKPIAEAEYIKLCMMDLVTVVKRNEKKKKKKRKEISCVFLTEMETDNWIRDFAFTVDAMQKLNERNTKLQGKSVFAHEL